MLPLLGEISVTMPQKRVFMYVYIIKYICNIYAIYIYKLYSICNILYVCACLWVKFFSSNDFFLFRLMVLDVGEVEKKPRFECVEIDH